MTSKFIRARLSSCCCKGKGRAIKKTEQHSRVLWSNSAKFQYNTPSSYQPQRDQIIGLWTADAASDLGSQSCRFDIYIPEFVYSVAYFHQNVSRHVYVGQSFFVQRLILVSLLAIYDSSTCTCVYRMLFRAFDLVS